MLSGRMSRPPRPRGRYEAQVRAFEALRDVLVPERWEDVDELVRAAFLAGWYAGAAWRVTKHAMCRLVDR